MSRIAKVVSTLSKLLLLCSLTLLFNQVLLAEIAAPTDAPEWGAPPGTRISDGVSDTEAPYISYSANGSRLIIGYIQRLGSDKTSPSIPKYALSTNNGQSWSTPANIITNNTNATSELKVDFTNQTAHAVWVETDFSGDGQDRLLVASESTWPASNPRQLDLSAHADSFIITPDIATRGNQIHIVWSQGLPANINHAWSNDGGNTWFTSPTITTGLESIEADIAIGDNGVIHLIWQELLTNTSKQIAYVQGVINGTNISWSAPITLVGDENSTPPNIDATGNLLRLNYGRIIEEDGEELQDVRYMTCDGQCSNVANWDAQGSISGAVVGVNNAPSDLISDLAHDTSINTTFVYFHGFTSNNNEIILGVNDCDGWVSSGRDEVTEVSDRSIRPNIALHNGTMQLVYQFEDDANSIIYHMRGNVSCSNRAYMPIVFN